jgi:formamidopyrimidine-DNA glycosylase
MPELPEVETVRRKLVPHLAGRTIVRARIDDTRLVRPEPPEVVAARLTGARVTALGRRGKHLLIGLEDGGTLAVHLRMTGKFLLGDVPADHPHLRAVLELDDATTVAYADQRRFGTWRVLEGEPELQEFLDERLGVEPLDEDFDGRVLAKLFAGRRASIKAMLLDQRLIAGVGNIYADEALWAAKVHPETPAGLVSRPKLDLLAAAIRDVLEVALVAQGSTLRDFQSPDGAYGSMQERFKVFDRTGEPCLRCGTPIVKLRVAGRGTHVCPRCQRRRLG